MYALFPWMQRYRVFDAPSKATEQDFSITEEDFSALRLDKVPGHEHQRSSFLVTPALLKSNSRGSLNTFDTLRSSLLSVRTENEMLQGKVEVLNAENQSLRNSIKELELALRQAETKHSENAGVSDCKEDESVEVVYPPAQMS